MALGLAVNVLLVDCGSPLTATSKLTDADFDDSGYVPVDPFDADGRSELIDGTPIHPLLIAAATGLAKFTIPNLRRYVLDAKSRIVDNQG